MPTLSALVRRADLRLLTNEAVGTRRIDSALMTTETDLCGWADADPDTLQSVLVILPLSSEGSSDPAGLVLRWLSDVRAGGVVFATGMANSGSDEFDSLAAAVAGNDTPLLTAAGEPYEVWTAVTRAIRDERAHASQATDHLREMHREVTRPDGLERLVRWLARRVAGRVLLLDRAGAPRYAFPEMPEDVIQEAAEDIGRVVGGKAGAAAVDIDAGVVQIQALGERSQEATFVVARSEPFSAPMRNLIGEAVPLLSLRWRAEDLGRRERAVTAAEARAREAVLHLLIVGQLQAARRVAGALGPHLAEEFCVYIVECPPDARDRFVAQCDRASRGRAWIVRCPIYSRHIIVLAPAPEAVDAMDETLRVHADGWKGVDVGRSQTVTMAETASGYGQAFHALAVARGSAGHYAVFDPRGDLAALVRAHGYEWARALLEPLRGYRPQRAQDPDAAELTATLQSWLAFYGGAAQQLKVHRNTVSSRLRHIERLLGRQLDDLETQAKLDLALRVLDGPGGTPGAADLETILKTPEVRDWAAMQIAPLASLDSRLFLETLRVWLQNNARLEPTAAALGISAPGARKRLTRIEELLGRSLLNGPSARYDLWFALGIHDL